ncbi:MAG: lipid-A-disaccharide synthase [Sodalis sp. (in: enterobacteria)]
MSEHHPIIIGLVTGEISGDIIGAGLIRALRRHLSQVRFVGIAGPYMQREGMESWYDIEELAVMGILEVVGHLPRLLRIRRDLIRRFSTIRPDVFVGIDAPEFTINLEKNLKRRGIRTIHYVSPSVWAWRQKRILNIGRATDNVLALLPFEKEFYDRYNVPCQFIGHTLADTIPLDPDKAAARLALGIPAAARCLALLPGSRQSEVGMLSADFLRAAILLRQHFPELEIIVPLVNAARRTQFEYINEKIAPTFPIRIFDNQARQVMIAADATLLASGSAALECMLAKCPMVVAYRMKPLTFTLARRLVKTPWVSLPNLLAKREIVKELLQEACRPDLLAGALIPLLHDNQEQRASLLDTFRQLHQQIRCNADEQAARAVLALINR